MRLAPLALLLAAAGCSSTAPRVTGSFRVAGSEAGRRLVLVDVARGRAVAGPEAPADALHRALESASSKVPDLSSLASLDGRAHTEASALFQQASWRLAEAWFNGALTDAEYVALVAELLRACADLARDGAGSLRRLPPAYERAPLGWIG